MALIRDWRKNLESKPVEQLKYLRKAVQTLNGWSMFRREYPEINTFKQMIEHALEVAGQRSEEVKNEKG